MMLQRLHNVPHCSYSRRNRHHVLTPACGSHADAVTVPCSSAARQPAAAASIPGTPAHKPHAGFHSAQYNIPLRDPGPSTRPSAASVNAISEGCGSGAAPAQSSAPQTQPSSHAHAGASHRQLEDGSARQRGSHGAAAHPSRRAALASVAALLPLAKLAHPEAACAAVVEAQNGLLIPPQPSLLDVFTGGASKLPPPVRFPRRTLAQRFAVLLMQSCYKAVDALDFIPMDEFQVRFWKLRQGAYADYLQAHSGLQIRQGNLADPLYFDFIAYAQFATISEAMESGRQEFEEFCEECETRHRTVRRNPELADNRLLPGAFQRVAGDRIYNALRNGFPRADGEMEQFGGPQPAAAGSTFADLAAGAAAIVDIFVARGFTDKGVVTDVRPNGSGGGTFTVRLDAPANLWGSAALAARRCNIVNAYDAFAVGGYLRASAVANASYVFTRTDAATETRWTLR